MKLSNKGIASALSIDHWSPPASSGCTCEKAPELSVNFLSMHPGGHPDEPKNGTSSPSSPSSPSTPVEPPNKPTAARFQEIFVDYVGMHCASLDAASRHILDDRFDSFLGKGEREFKEALMKLMQDGMTADARTTVAYRTLDEMLRSKMGFSTTCGWSKRRGKYHRQESNNTLGDDFLAGGLSSKPLSSRESIEPSGTLDSQAEILQSIVDAIQSNREVCRRLRFSVSKNSTSPPSASEEDQLRSILQKILPNESLDVLFASIKDPSFQRQASIFRSLLHPPGHVFVCNASVCDLHCDAFLCPGSISHSKNVMGGTIPKQWLNSLKQNKMLQQHICPYQFKHHEGKERVITHQHWPWKEFRNKTLAPVPFFVGGEVSFHTCKGGNSSSSDRLSLPPSEQHIEALMETAKQFISVALDELRSNQTKPLAGRERYLLAMPVIGTGGGFAGDLTGEVVEALLNLMAERAFAEGDLDMVLVCSDEATYAHAQSIRINLMRKSEKDDDTAAAAYSLELPSSCFPCFQWLTEDRRNHAEQLAELASSGHLALFMGAGVSMGSGLPSWFDLLHSVEDLFTPTGTQEERKLGNATNWDPLQMADFLEGICSSRQDRYGVKATLKRRICNHIEEHGPRPGLLLSLLISLPCQSIVTQNYDRLIEKAFECWNIRDALSSKELSVIPYHPRRNAHHWLLKMHGCITASEEIVISGQDYARYNESSRFKALGGLLQASLMTKHLLFVGFSLSDQNYLKIVEQVRSALHDDSIGIKWSKSGLQPFR